MVTQYASNWLNESQAKVSKQKLATLEVVKEQIVQNTKVQEQHKNRRQIKSL